MALLTGHWRDAGDLVDHAPAVAGLVVGGIVAAPLAGYVLRGCRRERSGFSLAY